MDEKHGTKDVGDGGELHRVVREVPDGGELYRVVREVPDGETHCSERHTRCGDASVGGECVKVAVKSETYSG